MDFVGFAPLQVTKNRTVDFSTFLCYFFYEYPTFVTIQIEPFVAYREV